MERFRAGAEAASLSVVAAAALVAGCAAYGPGDLSPGADEAAIVARMGPPSERRARPDGGTRLVYARGPEGRHTYMLELGADGRLTGWRQVLGEREFARIAPGLHADELRRDFGPPGDVMQLGRRDWVVWSWRYPTLDCRWFRVTLDEQRRVVDAGYAPDPVCIIVDDA